MSEGSPCLLHGLRWPEEERRRTEVIEVAARADAVVRGDAPLLAHSGLVEIARLAYPSRRLLFCRRSLSITVDTPAEGEAGVQQNGSPVNG